MFGWQFLIMATFERWPKLVFVEDDGTITSFYRGSWFATPFLLYEEGYMIPFDFVCGG